MRRFVGELFTSKKSRNEILKFIQEYLFVKSETAIATYDYFEEQYKYCKHIPHDKSILLEYQVEDKKMIFHALYGRRVNDCLSRAIAYVIAKKHGKDVEIGINDNGFSISGAQKNQIMDALKTLKSEKMELVMNNAIENSEVYKRRFRHCATRALMILRNYKGHQKRVGRQQVSSMILLNALRRISNDFTILKEARREVLEDLMDIENTKNVLKSIEEEKTKITLIDTRLPSPFAFTIAYQGHMDTMKIEDRHEFLRRMHQYVLASIGQKLTPEEKKSFDYKEYWSEQEKKRWEEKDEYKEHLKTLAWNLEHVPVRVKREIVEMIDDEKKEPSEEFLKGYKKYEKEIRDTWPEEIQTFVKKKMK